MKKIIAVLVLVFSFCFTSCVNAASEIEIKRFILNFANDISTGNLEALNNVSSSNRKLKNNLTTYMDSMTLTQQVEKITEKNGTYIVKAKGKLKYNEEKENNITVKYEITEDINGLTITDTDLFDNVGHGSIISSISSLITIVLISALIGFIVYFFIKKRNEKELRYMRKSECSTGLGGFMDHH